MERHRHDGRHATNASFPTETAGLPEVRGTEIVALSGGDEFTLEVAPVARHLGDAHVRMLAFNGSIPGPTLRVPQGSEVTVHVTNHTDMETTVHWHGLRLENAYDGTHETQAPIPVGGSFSYRLQFPDPGVYWYHPHVREDYGQELGLYGNILVVPDDPGYWPPANREVLLTLDDILLEDGRIAAFDRAETNYASMGRFGNRMLVGGELHPVLKARPSEVVRFHLTNVANSRVFNVAFPGARMKRVGGDSGRCEREEFVESVILAPSERAVIDVLFERSGSSGMEHRTPKRTYALATVEVGGEPASPSHSGAFAVLRQNSEWLAERERIAPFFGATPDKTIAIVAELDLEAPAGIATYSCPMHPEVVSEQPGRCPKCGMKLMAAASAAPGAGHAPHGHGSHGHGSHDHGSHDHGSHDHGSHDHGSHDHGSHGDAHEHAGHGHGPGDGLDGIEWEDEMIDLNRVTTSANTRWKFVERASGAANHAIDWRFRVGDRVKIRVVNEMDSDHPMQHPFHVHGAGRFVVLARGGVAERNLAWKDTVLLRTGETVDLLLDVTNPGVWMAHCHIAEHHESGMMFRFTVDPAAGPGERPA